MELVRRGQLNGRAEPVGEQRRSFRRVGHDLRLTGRVGSREALLAQLFDDPSHPLAASMAQWLSSSRRFAAFVADNHTKIRKKLRSTRQAEGLRDLGLELETAFLLQGERSFSLVYEPRLGGKGRGPDFAVRHSSRAEFTVEVTRLRLGPAAKDFEQRLTAVIAGKLGQLLPQRSNCLVVGVDARTPTVEEVGAALLTLMQRAEADDPSVIARHGFQDRRDFFRYFQRLSNVLVRSVPLPAGGEPAVTYENPQARHRLPSPVHGALARSHGA